MDRYVEKGDKRLRLGYTTGTCAAAAACGAAQMLLSEGEAEPCEIEIMTPKGILARIAVEELRLDQESALCCVRKDSGDDPDVTNGVLVYATVARLNETPGRIHINGGKGIGRVTKPGLACKVGEAAINPAPRSMIREEVEKIARRYGYSGSLAVEISIPAGIALAEKTFNPRLGILGGISVLGTSGIVEPMSEQALVDTIKAEVNVERAAGAKYLVLTPGNYGETFLKEKMRMTKISYVKCSNFIGDALDYIKDQDLKGVLLVGHIGKLVKVAAGVMNTHSKYGDKRMETLADHAREQGAAPEVVRELNGCVTTEEAITVLKRQGPELENSIWKSLLKQIKKHMDAQVEYRLETQAIIYSNQHGYLGETPGTEAFLSRAARNLQRR